MVPRHFLFTLMLPIVAQLGVAVACRAGSGAECDRSSFTPGHNLAGEGFDVVRMTRTGAYVINMKTHLSDNHTCTLCQNRFQGGQFQKLPTAVLNWRPFSHCSKQLTSALHHSVDSLLRSSSLVTNNWGAGLGLDQQGRPPLGGSLSETARFARSQHRADKATFALHEISCTFYSYRLAAHAQLSAEFSEHLRTLPKGYDVHSRALYRSLIDTYGTHYIHQVHLGGRVRRITAYRTCLATLEGFTESQIKSCLNIELRTALGFFPVVNANVSNTCISNASKGFYQGFMTHKVEVQGGEPDFPDLLYHPDAPSEAYRSWMSSLQANPEVVSCAVFPLHKLADDPKVGANLRTTISQYIQENQQSGDQEGQWRTCVPTANLDHNCCPLRAGRGELKLEIQRAAGLRADLFTGSDAFIKVWYEGWYRESVTVMDDDEPVWDTTYGLGSVELGHKLTVEVWDKDLLYNEMIGQCVVFPERGTHRHSCQLSTGVLYFTYHVSCDAHLTGYRCGQYSPIAK